MKLKLEISEQEVKDEMAFVIFTDMLVKLKSVNYVAMSDDGEEGFLCTEFDENNLPVMKYSFINLSEDERKKRQKEMAKYVRQGLENKEFFQTKNLLYFELSSTANIGGVLYKDEDQETYPVLYDKYTGYAEVVIDGEFYEYSLIHHFILAEADRYRDLMVEFELEDGALDDDNGIGGGSVC